LIIYTIQWYHSVGIHFHLSYKQTALNWKQTLLIFEYKLNLSSYTTLLWQAGRDTQPGQTTNLRIVSTNRCSGNIDTITMHKWHKDLRRKPPQGEDGKTMGVNQPVHASFTMSNLGTESL
jgi:hypothetical protein